MPTSSQSVVSRTRFTNFVRAHPENLVHSDSVAAPVISVTEPAGMVEVNQYVSAEIMFFGSDTAGSIDQTCAYDIYGIRLIGRNPDRDDSKGGVVLYVPFLLGSGVFTLSLSLSGLATGYLNATQMLADTLTWTPNAAFQSNYLDVLVGNNALAYSPADNTRPALLAFPDLLNFHGLVVDIKPDTADDGNALVSLWT